MRAADEHRVVVTGIGAVTPLGSTIADMWAGLVAGRSAVDYIARRLAIDWLPYPERAALGVYTLTERAGLRAGPGGAGNCGPPSLLPCRPHGPRRRPP